MSSVTEDQEAKTALEHLRATYARLLPLLAAVEYLLDIPEEERYVSQAWLVREWFDRPKDAGQVA